MRRIGLAASIAVLVGIIVVGTVIAAGGLGDLTRFYPSRGTVDQRLTKIETFLADQSRVLKTELPRMQNQLDGVTAVVQPAICPTDEEGAYGGALGTDLAAITNAFDELGERPDETIQAIRMSTQAMLDREPPPTLRGQALHAEAVKTAAATRALYE